MQSVHKACRAALVYRKGECPTLRQRLLLNNAAPRVNARSPSGRSRLGSPSRPFEPGCDKAGSFWPQDNRLFRYPRLRPTSRKRKGPLTFPAHGCPRSSSQLARVELRVNVWLVGLIETLELFPETLWWSLETDRRFPEIHRRFIEPGPRFIETQPR
jgi:hypothetical protein